MSSSSSSGKSSSCTSTVPVKISFRISSGENGRTSGRDSTNLQRCGIAAPRAVRCRDLYLEEFQPSRAEPSYGSRQWVNVPRLQDYVLATPEICAQFRSARDGDVIFPLVVCRTWARRRNAWRDGREWPWRDELLDTVTRCPGGTNRSRSNCGFFPLPLSYLLGGFRQCSLCRIGLIRASASFHVTLSRALCCAVLGCVVVIIESR
jgi:hypothetical protein